MAALAPDAKSAGTVSRRRGPPQRSLDSSARRQRPAPLDAPLDAPPLEAPLEARLERHSSAPVTQLGCSSGGAPLERPRRAAPPRSGDPAVVPLRAASGPSTSARLAAVSFFSSRSVPLPLPLLSLFPPQFILLLCLLLTWVSRQSFVFAPALLGGERGFQRIQLFPASTWHVLAVAEP